MDTNSISYGTVKMELENSFVRDRLKNEIFGRFYAIGAAMGQIEPVPQPGRSKAVGILGLLASLASLVVLIARAAYMLYRSNQADNLSLDWCFATALQYLALHAAISNLILFGIKYKTFIPNFLDLLLVASKNKIPKIHKSMNIRYIFITSTYILASVIYCVENLLNYDDYKVNGTIRDSARFRNSMFVKQWLFPIDMAIIIWGAIITTIALILHSCMNNGLCTAYREFHEEVEKMIENGSIKDNSKLYDVENQLIDFIKTNNYLTKTSGFAGGLIITSFSTGILVNISANLGLKELPHGSKALDIILLILWMVTSISMLVYSMIRPAQFYVQLNETKEMLCLEKSLWINSESQVREVAFGITDRLEKLIGSASTITASKSAFFVLNLILLVIPFLSDVLEAFISNKSN